MRSGLPVFQSAAEREVPASGISRSKLPAGKGTEPTVKVDCDPRVWVTLGWDMACGAGAGWLALTPPGLFPGGVTEGELPAVFAAGPLSITPEGKTVISPRPVAMVPTNSLSKGSLVTTVNRLERMGSESTARKYKPPLSRTRSRNLPATKWGMVRDVPLSSVHSGNGFSSLPGEDGGRAQGGGGVAQ